LLSGADGRASDLEVIRSAQAAALQMYPSGTMRLQSLQRSVVNGQQASENRLEGQIVWSGDAVFGDATLTSVEKDKKPQTWQERRIRRPNMRAVMLADIPALYVSVGDGRILPDHVLDYRPDQLWFGFERFCEQTWHSLLSAPVSSRRRYTVTEDGDLVRILIESLDNPPEWTKLDAVFSLPMRGMATRFSCSMPGGKSQMSRESSGTLEWNTLPDGRPVLRRYAFVATEHEKDVSRVTEFEMHVLEFDPDAKIPDSRFELASLDIEPGTMVEENGPNGLIRRYKWGNEPTDPEGKLRLNKLADELKREGFARPEKP
jgi:hypothetical protein